MVILLPACVLLAPTLVRATPEEASPAGSPFTADTSAPDPGRLEVGLLPAIDYDSEMGGASACSPPLAKFDPSRQPFAWRVQTLAFFTLRDDGRGIRAPYHDYYLRLDRPGFGVRALRPGSSLGTRSSTDPSSSPASPSRPHGSSGFIRAELGLTEFSDKERVWADFEPLRVDGCPHRWIDRGPRGRGRGWPSPSLGETFIIRADLAQALTEGTTGLYIDAGQIF